MSYTNGILNHDDSQGLGKIGSRGLPGIGFKLDSNNDYDMQNKKLVNVKQGTNNNDVVTKQYIDSEIAKIPIIDASKFVAISGDTMTGSLVVPKDNYPVHGDLNKVISYESQREIFLSKKEGGQMEANIDINNNTIFNVKDPTQADHATNKKYVDNQLVKKLDKNVDIDMTNKSITNLKLPSNQKDATNVEFVNKRITETQKNYLKLDGTTSMSGDLNLNNNKIVNLQTDYRDSKSAANVDFVQEEIKDLRNLVTQKIRESHINNSGQKRDAFRYLMEDDDESSSEKNINVLGIVDFPNTPHQINKKAYQLQLLFEKSSPNKYRSRLGFNLYKLPVGYYTMIVEWFPPEMNEITVTAQGKKISISDETTKTFDNYTKTVIHLHRWGSSPPQFLYLDLHGTVSKQSFLTIGHLRASFCKYRKPGASCEIFNFFIFCLNKPFTELFSKMQLKVPKALYFFKNRGKSENRHFGFRHHQKKGKMVHFRFARTAKRGNVYRCTFSKSQHHSCSFQICSLFGKSC